MDNSAYDMIGSHKTVSWDIHNIAETKQSPSLVRELRARMPALNISLVGPGCYEDLLYKELAFNDISTKKFKYVRMADADLHAFLSYSVPIYNGDKSFSLPIDPLKFEKRRLLNDDEISALKEQYKIRNKDNVVLVGSLHEHEIPNIAASLQHYLEKKPNSKLVIVPYTEDTLATLSEYLKFETDSCTITGNKKCVVIEQQGILDKLYSVADKVLIGNTFHAFAYDGQNPLEPAFYGKPTISGADYHKWNKVAYDGLKNSGLLKRVGASGLEKELTLNAPAAEIIKAKKAAADFIESQQGAAKIYAYLMQQAIYNNLNELDKQFLSKEQTFDELKGRYWDAARVSP